ncbi:PREDICTED: uncharacterized protein At4g04775-like [Camelina sativa]|uniref:Uncharacterized protein At4g04775-like n=1 Tax=Camelina sativa TaxID=90675 RepID=A0ABM0Y520_CAMSA|nr:PREDICTED: uncharacterized protein At4g04775-like [Camelina sativa]
MSDSSSSYHSAHRLSPPEVLTSCRCWCGQETITFTSKTKENPYRRFYRCSIALKRPNEEHLFKWVDEALVEEIQMVNRKLKRIEEDVSDLRINVIQNLDLQKEMLKKLEGNMVKKLEENMVKKIEDKMASSALKTIGIVAVIGGALVLLWGRI